MSPLETSLRIALSEAGVAHNASMSEIRQTVTQIFESPQWRREALYEASEQARREIASWPEWKRKMAEAHLSQPMPEFPDRGEDFNARW